jgi:hypothetical protein
VGKAALPVGDQGTRPWKPEGGTEGGVDGGWIFIFFLQDIKRDEV